MAERRSISKVLVANRGEIARRVFASCRRMGIATVAVYSDVDASAPFVADADEAVPLEGATAAESYLRGEAVVEAAQRIGADAIHPGYGFLAENAEFARAVGDAGLVWIGPPPEAIEVMGSKVRARAQMEEAGVPILPGAELNDGSNAAAEAEQIGFPLLVKASAGGGGKGMRTVAEAAELEAAVEGARREAESAFGDGTIFLERLLERPRHIEIQVFADEAGNTVSLGERECSIQRRHQKVVEEAPSVAVDPDLRKRMGEAAVAAAEAVSYVGAGTVEFLLGPDGEFYFLEMNTRLQVEHPVTELVTGLDLVRLQLSVAAGESLTADIGAGEPRGHAIEVRLYAEDPAAGFLPQTGTVAAIEVPGAEQFATAAAAAVPDGPVRLDSGIESGDLVSPHYDPMLAKVVVWAPTRIEAAARMARALRHSRVHGIVTNRDFLVRTLEHAAFREGETDTGFIPRHEADLIEPLVGQDERSAHLIAAALWGMGERSAERERLDFAPPGWRNNPSGLQTVRFGVGGEEIEVGYRLARAGLQVEVDGKAVEVELHPDSGEEGAVGVTVAGVRRRYLVSAASGDGDGGRDLFVNSSIGQLHISELPRYPDQGAAAVEGALVAPMPGKVLSLAVSAGDQVEKGQVIAVLEAMKMEHELVASGPGTLSEFEVDAGDQVEAGSVIAVISPGDPGDD